MLTITFNSIIIIFYKLAWPWKLFFATICICRAKNDLPFSTQIRLYGLIRFTVFAGV